MEFFSKAFLNKPSSKDVAKDRLKLILIHDRGDLSPQLLDMIKSEILEVINKYVEIDSADIEMELTRTSESEGNYPALIANIPIKKLKQR